MERHGLELGELGVTKSVGLSLHRLDLVVGTLQRSGVLLLDLPRGPCLQGMANGGTSRVPRKMFLCVRRVYDHAESRHVLR